MNASLIQVQCGCDWDMVRLEGGDGVGGFRVNVTRGTREEWASGLRDPSDRCALTKCRAGGQKGGSTWG